MYKTNNKFHNSMKLYIIRALKSYKTFKTLSMPFQWVSNFNDSYSLFSHHQHQHPLFCSFNFILFSLLCFVNCMIEIVWTLILYDSWIWTAKKKLNELKIRIMNSKNIFWNDSEVWWWFSGFFFGVYVYGKFYGSI